MMLGTIAPPATSAGTGSSAGAPAEGRRRVGRAVLRRTARREGRRSLLRELPILLGVAVLISLVLKTFLVQAFVIPSGSMEQTIGIGDRVLVDKFSPWFGSEPERGEVVVFRDPGGWLEDPPEDTSPVVIRQLRQALTFIGLMPSEHGEDLIKRVIGVGGDTVACCDSEGRVTVNGQALDETYLYPGDEPSNIEFRVTVPQGRIFVMGDHRSDSSDSRFHLQDEGNGTVPVDDVVGRAIVTVWPFDRWQRLSVPETFDAVPPTVASGPPSPGGTSPEPVSAAPVPGTAPLVVPLAGAALALPLRPRSRVSRRLRHRHGAQSGRR
nr:signal peptidase I [Allostreptomyces psammosilenae]